MGKIKVVYTPRKHAKQKRTEKREKFVDYTNVRRYCPSGIDDYSVQGSNPAFLLIAVLQNVLERHDMYLARAILVCDS